MRDDGTILTTTRYCGGSKLSDGLIQFELCGSVSLKKFVYLTPEGDTLVMVDALQAGPFSEGLAAISEKGKWGYMNERGEVIIPARFDEADEFREGLAAVQVGDVWQYIDHGGRAVLTPHLAGKQIFKPYGFRSGSALVIVFDKTDNTYFKGLIDRSGNWLIDPSANLAGELDHGLAPFWSTPPGLEGFVDRAGRMVIAPQFAGSASLPFEEGLAAVFLANAAGKKAGFIDERGRWVVPPRFEDAYHFCGGLAPVKVGGKWGFIDPVGDVMIAPAYEGAESFDGGIAIVYGKDEKGILRQDLINRKGAVLYRSSRKAEIIDF
ncbi:MAG TPA: WG repeat-containing protein [Terriglobales bacterium]|nr:WG repeat-containing protein [Terriglobales bacterium]